MTAFTTARAFDATPAQVFAACSDPTRLARWWGPAGFRNTFTTFEFTTGGNWRFTMHGPDGSDYPNEALFQTIQPNREIIIQHTNAPRFTLTIRLSAIPSGTQVTWDQVFESPEIAAAVKHIVVPANEQNLDRWQAEVATGGR